MEKAGVVTDEFPFGLVVFKLIDKALVELCGVFFNTTVGNLFQEVLRLMQRISLPCLRDHRINRFIRIDVLLFGPHPLLPLKSLVQTRQQLSVGFLFKRWQKCVEIIQMPGQLRTLAHSLFEDGGIENFVETADDVELGTDWEHGADVLEAVL